MTSAATMATEPSPEVPIFLRKTYHMVDTCDPVIASWSEDGETFVVKDPFQFERTIIPQFFKHSKFSSFVRQLNFYSFRKIKYADTIKIDPKLEEETANYWRFRHENFRRGRPDLLSEIKRMNGQKGQPSTVTTGSNKIEIPNESTVAPTTERPNKEVQSLKKKIEEMTKNIDELTQIVQKVSLKQEEQEKIVDERLHQFPELKRKKVKEESELLLPESVLSGATSFSPEQQKANNDSLVPIEMLSMDLDDIVLSSMGEVGMSPLDSRETSENTQVTDTEFVDQLFTAFNSGDDDDEGSISFPMVSSLMPTDPVLMPQMEKVEDNISRRPDPELMQRLGDALMLLPREIQEMIVNRLIAAITSSEGLEIVAAKEPVAAVVVDQQTPDAIPKLDSEAEEYRQQQMPLAAATFAALLRHYTQQMQGGKCAKKNVPKAIPVIPVHA